MRLLALVPALLCTAALILSFLCLFAGSNKGFMESYSIVTLNTSRIGQDVFNTTESSSNPIVGFLKNLTNSIESQIQEEFSSFAKDLGLHDFYSAHLLDYCEGYYVPGPVPNATLSRSSISQNVTACSNHTDGFTFDARTILQRQLNNSGHSNINLNDLHWPKAIDEGLNALRVAAHATFVLYCIGVGLIGIATILALISVFFNGRLSAFINVVVDWLAFLIIGIASAIATAVAVKSTDVINKYGGRVGISAYRGNKFLALTWVATGLVLIASIVWCFSCIVGRKSARSRKNAEKGYN